MSVDRQWPDRSSEWSQQDLHAYVRQMGINPDPHEIIPQGVKYIAWPQPRLTEAEIEHCQEIARQLEDGTLKSLNIAIPRRRDPRRN
jgi:hypothetical protein